MLSVALAARPAAAAEPTSDGGALYVLDVRASFGLEKRGDKLLARLVQWTTRPGRFAAAPSPLDARYLLRVELNETTRYGCSVVLRLVDAESTCAASWLEWNGDCAHLESSLEHLAETLVTVPARSENRRYGLYKRVPERICDELVLEWMWDVEVPPPPQRLEPGERDRIFATLAEANLESNDNPSAAVLLDAARLYERLTLDALAAGDLVPARGYYRQALQLLNRFTTTYPNHPELESVLYRLYVASVAPIVGVRTQGADEASSSYLKSLAKVAPGSERLLRVCLMQGLKYLEDGHWPRGAALLRVAAGSADPLVSAYASFALASCVRRMGQRQEAHTLALDALERLPKGRAAPKAALAVRQLLEEVSPNGRAIGKDAEPR